MPVRQSAFFLALPFVVAATVLPSGAYAQGAGARIVEVFDTVPRLTTAPGLQKAATRPQRQWAPFGGALDVRSFSTTVLGRYGVSQIPLRGTLLENVLNLSVVPVCGPSVHTNTLACFNLASGEFLEELPVPGSVSTQPLFFDGSWFFGTTEGFFMRTSASSLRSTPLLGGENVGFWGHASRSMMRGMRPRTSLDGPEKPTDALAVYRNTPRQGYRWQASSSFEYVGSPVVFGTQVFVLTANQYLLALDSQTGRTIWGTRLAPESSLRLSASPLIATAKEILVGTDDGQVMALNPRDGAVLWRYLIPARGDERFKAVVASPALVGRSVVFSSAEGSTTRLALDGRTVEWTYPVGSVPQVRFDDSNIYLGGSDGSLSSLEGRAGALRWRVALSADSPVASVWLLRKKELLLVASKKGVVSLVDARQGRKLAELPAAGAVVGEFFAGYGASDACLSFTNGGFKCYSADATNASYALAGDVK
ncbi:MAG: PQQ-binding-like beta-propeller repeat protein [Silvanigrellales bacterium]|nr:PQQ-binding-like beta-propeller repeat protein [Silvanigrellales bacterium]